MSATGEPRLAPLPVEQWDDDAIAALEAGFPGAAERFAAGGANAPPVPNVLGTLLHHPALAGPFLRYNQVLLQTPALGARRRELLVLRVAWRTRSTYEWLQHVRIATAAGVTRDEIEAITRSDRGDSWSEGDDALLAAVDELLDDWRISDATWARLAADLDESKLVELVFTVGTYAGLAMAFNSFGLQIDPELEALDAPRPTAIG